MLHLPLAVCGLVTQLLADADNSRLASTCREAAAWLRAAPREAEFVIRHNTRDMYGRYRRIRVLIQRSRFPTWRFLASFVDVQRMFDLLAHIRDVHTLAFDMGGGDDGDQFAVETSFEIALMMERLPEFPAVRTLDIWNWSCFRAFAKFPNCTHLRVDSERIALHPRQHPLWPDMPHLTCLVWRGRDGYVGAKPPSNWTTVEELETDTGMVPETYNRLVVCVSPNSSLPAASFATIEVLCPDTEMLGCEHRYDEPCCHKGNLDPKMLDLPRLERLWTTTADEEVFGNHHFVGSW
jgi:hypothetical protein